MPKSKSKRRRYQPPPKRKPKPSPKWFGATIVSLWFLGVIVIVLNYLALMPFSHGSPTNLWLFVGLVFIAVGFLAATQWR
jgi:cell division protein CrgA